jgi:hypothetical protein
MSQRVEDVIREISNYTNRGTMLTLQNHQVRLLDVTEML